MHPQIENKIKPAQQKHLRTVVIQFEIFHPGRRDGPFIREICILLAGKRAIYEILIEK